MIKNKKVLLTLLAGFAVVVSLPLMAAYEAHVINVTAHIENALRVHPVGPFDYGTVFPQEYFFGAGFGVGTSDSFSAPEQTRVQNIDYIIKQKPKPKPEFETSVGVYEARSWCHENMPSSMPEDPNDPYYQNCYPYLCPYISKIPQNEEPGDVGVPSFHDPEKIWATGTLHKQIIPTDPIPMDIDDFWILDLAVPCFDGMCAQDWPDFVKEHNPNANPDDYTPPESLESSTFGCDLWIEITDVY